VAEARERTLGARHEDTLVSWGALGALLSEVQFVARMKGIETDWREAEELLQSALAGMREELGDDHPNTMVTRSNLAAVFFDQEKHDEALPLVEEALETSIRVLGPTHPSTLVTRNNHAYQIGALGHLTGDADMLSDAEELLREVIEDFGESLGPDHFDCLVSRNNLAEVLDWAGRTEEALEVSQGALDARRRLLGPAHTRTLLTLNHCVYYLRKLGRQAEAADLLTQALAELPSGSAAERDFRPDLLANLGFCMRHLGLHDEAERRLLEALELVDAGLSNTQSDPIRILRSLARVYEAMDNVEKVREVEEQLAARGASR